MDGLLSNNNSMNELWFLISFSKLFCFLCFSIQFCECPPGIHLHDGRFLGDIATCQRSDHGVRTFTKLVEDIWLAAAQQITATIARYRFIEVRKERSEILFERGHPIEDADEMRL